MAHTYSLQEDDTTKQEHDQISGRKDAVKTAAIDREASHAARTEAYLQREKQKDQWNIPRPDFTDPEDYRAYLKNVK